MEAPPPWVVITGGGSGIGRGLVHHFCQQGPVLTCGRRLESLRQTKDTAPTPKAVFIVACDIASSEGRQQFLDALPSEASVRLLVQNAAIGDPAAFEQLDLKHFEEALKVNLIAPMALMQGLLPRLRRVPGRVLHLGTSVAHHPQKGTATYGITKAAFHRLYQQLNAEELGVPVATLSPGLVDTEGVRDHVSKARRLDLPHVNFFDAAFEKGWTTDMAQLMTFVEHLLSTTDADFTAKEWRFSDWRKQVEASQASL